ncbi:NAD(P)/FAD-dependent oxidoreductase [Roseivirga sp. BDSF3-8]|uniref:NAD(P)/FAD-dependent oxidoreductase n=1 Tax=Roseivirga sp. BDSF3-8 TaxID=3241598 RepID=UPI00353190D0
MADSEIFDVIIIGGSYAGLSAAMTLGRALRNVLIIDSGAPCNRQTPHSHNFITQDGETPAAIAKNAKAQVLAYDTVTFHQDIAVSGEKTSHGFLIRTDSGKAFTARKLIFATGIKDIMPEMNGFAECWGISILHCPYCHGYEVKNEITGILANGDTAYHYARLIINWTKHLTLFTNGRSTLTQEQTDKLAANHIQIIENDIAELTHESGYLKEIVFNDKTRFRLKALYSRPAIEQHCPIPGQLGCELNEQGLLQVDMFQKTTVEGIYACGDNASPLRAVSHAVATGNIAGGMLNNAMTEEAF